MPLIALYINKRMSMKRRFIVIIKGKYNEAHVFTDNLEKNARAQILNLVNE